MIEFRIQQRFVPAENVKGEDGAQIREDFLQYTLDGKTWVDVPKDVPVVSDDDETEPDILDIENWGFI